MPGDVLRFELSRADLTITANGQKISPNSVNAEIANGLIASDPRNRLPLFCRRLITAQESELSALELALRQNSHIHILGVVVIPERPASSIRAVYFRLNI